MATHQHELARVRSWLRLHPEGFVRAYANRQINSIYFDTPTLGCLNDNLRGGSWRQKLRLRWYGTETEGVKAQLELKRKRGLLGDKKIVYLENPINLSWSWDELRQNLRQQLPPNWQLIVDEAIRPMLLNRYEREYLVSRDGNIRATLDYNQRAYDQRMSQRPQLSRKTPLPRHMVVEVKADEIYEERLCEVANRLPMSRTRNSKYVSGVLAAMG